VGGLIFSKACFSRIFLDFPDKSFKMSFFGLRAMGFSVGESNPSIEPLLRGSFGAVVHGTGLTAISTSVT
jgi:hypothetical protein